jgi:hypothetical protein
MNSNRCPSLFISLKKAVSAQYVPLKKGPYRSKAAFFIDMQQPAISRIKRGSDSGNQRLNSQK